MAVTTILGLRRRVLSELRLAERILRELHPEATEADREYIRGVIDAYLQIIDITGSTK